MTQKEREEVRRAVEVLKKHLDLKAIEIDFDSGAVCITEEEGMVLFDIPGDHDTNDIANTVIQGIEEANKP